MCGKIALVCCLVLLFFTSHACWAQGKSDVFFSQGQALDSPQDRARSKNNAMQDFLVQAVTQAVASLLSPSQMGSKFAPLQEKILNQPQRYVETYQIFSEASSGGLYRVRGQVTVLMEVLKKDLLSSGFALAGPHRPETTSSAAPEVLKPTAAGGEQKADREKASRGMSVSKQEFFWSVAERWERGWYLPQDRRDSRTPFAMSVLQESQGYGWSLRLPQAGSMSIDDSGNVPFEEVASLSKRLGIPKAIVGTLTARRSQGQGGILEVSLRILDVFSGRSEGEIHKELPMDGSSYQEGAMDLAAVVVPQLDRLFQEPPRVADSLQRSGPVRATGEWTLIIQGDNQFAYWEELEKTLQEQFKSIRIKGLELGADAVKVKVDGIDGQFLTSLQGTLVGGGVLVQVSEFSPDDHSVNLTLSRP